MYLEPKVLMWEYLVYVYLEEAYLAMKETLIKI